MNSSLEYGDFGCNVLADSVSPDGVRLTTLEVQFPRFILAEVNTHRALSRNSASSRAIPTEKLMDRVRTKPFVPLTFNKRVKGMGVGEALHATSAERSKKAWLTACNHALFAARQLVDLDVDKSRVNRLLEPFLWHTAIISATEWDNMLALRDHPAAQPEFQVLAALMREAFTESTPCPLGEGAWHLPLVTAEELEQLDYEHDGQRRLEMLHELKLISASRCARVSYDKHADGELIENTIQRARRLMESGHLSPFEHVARPMTNDDVAEGPWVMGVRPLWTGDEGFYCGNLRGWVQMRKEIQHEDRFDRLLETQAV